MKKTKKFISTIAFLSLLTLNVPVYANVAPPATNVEATAEDTTEDTTADDTAEDTTTEDTTADDTADDTTTEDTTADDTADDTTTEDTTADDTADDTTTEEESTEINPDDALYVLDRLFENIQITLTIDDVNKAALLASITEERLSEVKYLLDKAETDEVNMEEWDALIENVITDYKDKLEKAIESVEEVAIDITEEDMEKLDEILTKLDESLEVDEDVLETDEEVGEVVDRAILVANVVKDLDKEKVAEIREKGLGLGQISQIFALAEASDKEVDEIAELFVEQGLGFGDVAKELGVSPSELAKKKVEEKKLKRALKKNKNFNEDEEATDEQEIDEENESNYLNSEVQSENEELDESDLDDENEDEDDSNTKEKVDNKNGKPSKGKNNSKAKNNKK